MFPLLGSRGFNCSQVMLVGASQVAGSVVRNSPASAGGTIDAGSIPGLGRSPGGGSDNLLHYSCLGNPMEPGGLQSMRSQRVRHHWAVLVNTSREGRSQGKGRICPGPYRPVACQHSSVIQAEEPAGTKEGLHDACRDAGGCTEQDWGQERLRAHS